MNLQIYWFEFNLTLEEPHPIGVLIGCGVTAYTIEDAKFLMKQQLFKSEIPDISRVVENVEISQLDQDHVVPNMGNVLKRGIWFPRIS
jgi:hypothetical protein